MASLVNYKGLSVLDAASEPGGQAISDNFQRIVDSAPRSVWDKTGDPTDTDDGTATDPALNYQVGSFWLNISTNKLFVCTDNAHLHAKWQLVPYHLLPTADGVNQPKLSADVDVNGHGITSSSNGPIVISPNGTGALQIDTDGNARGGQAVDFQSLRGNASQVASGARSFIAGGNRNTAYGQFAHAEGYYNVAFGGASHAEGYSNTASGFASHAEGMFNRATGNASHAEGNSTYAYGISCHSEGQVTQAAGYCAHAEGSGAQAYGNFSHAEGTQTSATGVYSSAGGFYSVCHLTGQWSRASGAFSQGKGTAQTTITQVFCRTSNATASELTLNGSRFNLADGQTLSCFINIVGRKESGGSNDHASFLRQVCIRRQGSTTSLVGSVQTIGTINPAAWGGVSITADTTNQSLKIEVTGAASTNIRWMATVMASEVADAAI